MPLTMKKTIRTETTLSVISTIKLEENTAVHSSWPDARNVAVIKDDVLPVAPPKTNTVIGAETTTAIKVMMMPEIMVLGIFLKNPNFESNPAPTPIAIEVKAYGK